MKVAIITYAFYESTLPLFKHLSEFCDVDLYCLFSSRFMNPPSFDLSNIDLKNKNKQIERLSNNVIPLEIREYLGAKIDKVNIFVYKSTLKNLLFQNESFGELIYNENYDCVHFINLSSIYLPVLKKIRFKRVICSIHEANVDNAYKKGELFKNLIKYLQIRRAKKNIKYFNYITFFSENERGKFLANFNSFENRSCVIKFGLFETFKYFPLKNDQFSKISPGYFLYVGYIRPYKGVDFLLEAIKNNIKLDDIKFVIAGKDEMKLMNSNNLPNVIFINRFLNDSEIATLVNNSIAIILPYQSASQSGLPNVAFSFKKPIINSRIDGLNEYLIDNYNSVSFEVNNEEELVVAILKLQNVENLKLIESNIENYPFKEDLSWEKIALSFYNIY